MECKYACKICDRKFASGKSMGGHMRSHFVKLPVHPKPSSPRPSELLNAPNSSDLLIAQKTITSAPRDNSASCFFSLDSYYAHRSRVHFASSPSKFSAPMELGVRASARKRFSRTRPQLKGMRSAQLNAPLLTPKCGNFSLPDKLVTVEDVAICLMMLSNDKWPEGVHHPKVTVVSDLDDTPKEIDALDSDEDDKDDEDYDDTSDSLGANVFGHRCETCKKVFNSYQALGGHMRNHKRPVTQPALPVEKRKFACKICRKVFPSGQALGGHKKVHLSAEKKLKVGNPLPKNKHIVIKVDSDSESDSGFWSASISSADKTNSDTVTYYKGGC